MCTKLVSPSTSCAVAPGCIAVLEITTALCLIAWNGHITPRVHRLLESCPYSHATFADILNKIQKAIDDLSLHQYSNLGTWVSRLDEAIEERLASRWAEARGRGGRRGGGTGCRCEC